MSQRATWQWGIIGTLFLTLFTFQVQAAGRDAAFVDPGVAGAGAAPEEALKVEPKADIDTGESALSVARHTTLFFVNQSPQPLQIKKLDINNDSNVTAEVVNDDCSKQGTLVPASRCSIEISVTPTSPGPWSVDILLNHNGAGNIAHAKLTGKTPAVNSGGDKKDTGLAFSTKDNPPVNFGDVDVGGKAVRSALMVNDSLEPISLYAIDAIEADNGLQRLDQGCAIDMELKPGESCPVTLLWTPTTKGQISTDLIIRHSGRLGFVVIPIRGNARGDATAGKTDTASGAKSTSTSDNSSSKTVIPPPPTADALSKATEGKIDAVLSSALNSASTKPPSSPAGSGGPYRLIGTVGSRAVLLLPDGSTVVANVGDEVGGDDERAKVIAITAKSADIIVDGKKKNLQLAYAPELTTKASLHGRDSSASPSSFDISGGSSQGGPAGNSTPINPAGQNGVSLPGASAPSAANPIQVTPLLPTSSASAGGAR